MPFGYLSYPLCFYIHQDNATVHTALHAKEQVNKTTTIADQSMHVRCADVVEKSRGPIR
eukprot:IDg9935t1